MFKTSSASCCTMNIIFAHLADLAGNHTVIQETLFQPNAAIWTILQLPKSLPTIFGSATSHRLSQRYRFPILGFRIRISHPPFLCHMPLSLHHIHKICKHSLKTFTFFAYVPSISLLKCLKFQLPYHSSAYPGSSPHPHNQVQL